MRVISLLTALILASCASTKEDFRVWGHSIGDSHFTSVTEVIGRPEFFDGQPISVVGVVQFRHDDQPVFRLYASSEDLRNSVPAAIKVGTFSESLKISDEDMRHLNGRTVMLEGTFIMINRPKFEHSSNDYVCLHECGVPGEVDDIRMISTWPP